MCVLFCANANTAYWTDVSDAIVYRKGLTLLAVYADNFRPEEKRSPAQCKEVQLLTHDGKPVTLAKVQNRAAWQQAYCHRLAFVGLSQNGHHPFETVANAWRRLLAFVRRSR